MCQVPLRWWALHLHIPEFKFQNHSALAVTVSNLTSELPSVSPNRNEANKVYSPVVQSNEMRSVLST